jgi:molybdenum cofactor biosynthesis protein MoaC
MDKFSHIDRNGRVTMVDVSGKQKTKREAVATAKITMQPQTVAAVMDEKVPKGNALTTAQLAGIQAAKQTARLIPLCHPLSIDWIDVRLDDEPDGFRIEACVRVQESTGVEMEALTAVSVAALTLYDMCKAIDKTMEIGAIKLVRKTGGKSGK